MSDKKTQIIKGAVVLAVVWAIIAGGVFIFTKYDVTATETTNVDPDMQAAVTDLLDENLTVSYDFSDQAKEYWQLIQTDYADRGAQVVKENQNRHEEFKEYIISELKAAGFADEDIELDKHTETTVANDDLHAVNIIATLEGSDPSKEIVIVGGYDGMYDPTKVDYLDADDGSSAAIMLAEATGIAKSAYKPKCTIKFVFGDGEANSFRGSEWYARTMTKKKVEKTLMTIRVLSSPEKIYGQKTGECVVTGGITDGEDQVATEALEYAKASASANGITVKEGKLDKKANNPFAYYGMEYVDVDTDMNGDAVKMIAAMLMCAK